MILDKFIFQKHLEKDESISFVAHKHWVNFLPSFFRILLFGFILPWLIYFMGFKSELFLMIAGIWTVLAFLRLIYDWIDWHTDVWLFTNMSIIVVEWQGLFSNTSKRIGYEDAEGISFVVKGFWGTIFRYGDVTLGVISGSHVLMQKAASPKKVELALMQNQSNYMKDKEWKDASGLKQMLSKMVQHHLRQKK